MKYPMPLMEIVWYDAETQHGWELNEDTDTSNVPITTIGFMVAKGEHNVVIASSIDSVSGNQNNSRIKIPIGMIVSVKELNVSYKKPKNEQPSKTVDSGEV